MSGALEVFGVHEDNTIRQAEAIAEDAVHTVLMPDGHFGYGMPVGGVAAYRNQVSGEGVGFDIACGNAAILTDLRADFLHPMAVRGALADEIQATISFGVGRSNKADDAPTDDPLFTDPAWEVLADIAGRSERDSLHTKALNQLGTVGSGNHYVDVFTDELGRVWVGVHFGSRGLGHTIASGFYAMSQGEKWGARVKESHALFDLDSEIGDAYWRLMTLAGRYAYAGREWVTRKVVSILGGQEVDLVHNHHNFAWKEEHFGEELVVVRKGATPAFPGQRGFVGGSMGDMSVILEGAAHHTTQERMLFSTVHGAGRVMGRQEAIRGRVARDADGRPVGERDASTKITHQMQREWLNAAGVVLRGGGVDESPHVYRRLPDVLDVVGGTVNVLHTLTPLIVVMADDRTRDPYKD
jgi:tRNA-splicing ligase RtcB